MYHVYSVSGIIVGIRDIGEANRLISIATDTDGLVVAKAQGIRKESSKLRYVSQLYTGVTAEVVRGKEGWKLIGIRAESRYDVGFDLLPLPARKVIARIARITDWFSGESSDTEKLAWVLVRSSDLMRQGIVPSIVLIAGYAYLFGILGYIERQDYLSDEFIVQLQNDATMRAQLSARVTSAAKNAVS
jgi:hypothetical protein